MDKEEQNSLQNYSHQILNILGLELEYAFKKRIFTFRKTLRLPDWIFFTYTFLRLSYTKFLDIKYISFT